MPDIKMNLENIKHLINHYNFMYRKISKLILKMLVGGI